MCAFAVSTLHPTFQSQTHHNLLAAIYSVRPKLPIWGLPWRCRPWPLSRIWHVLTFTWFFSKLNSYNILQHKSNTCFFQKSWTFWPNKKINSNSYLFIYFRFFLQWSYKSFISTHYICINVIYMYIYKHEHLFCTMYMCLLYISSHIERCWENTMDTFYVL